MALKQQTLPRVIRTKMAEARVARLATLDEQFKPHVVPVCFAYDGKAFYTAIDRKPKRVTPDRLTRVRNILAAPQVSLLIDNYDEDWKKLWYVLIRGYATLIPTSRREERSRAIRKLKAKYPQYTETLLADDAPVIRITPQRAAVWGNI
jgi:PPOX class probable F420-dependent enzyme